MTTPAPAESRAQRPAPQVRGPWVVAATLSLFLIVPTFTFLVWAWVSPGFDTDSASRAAPPGSLLWSQRERWPRNQFETPKSLERGMMSAARRNETYEDLGFHLTPEAQRAILQCAALAGNPETFLEEATRQTLESVLAEQPDLFYAQYLLGTWYRVHDRPDVSEQAYEAAFAHAPAALVKRYTLTNGDPAADQPVPPIALGADQVVDDTLDQSVVLVFPLLRTDTSGFVYLPVFKTILRPAPLDTAALGGVVPVEEKPQWFTWYGHVGRLYDTTLP